MSNDHIYAEDILEVSKKYILAATYVEYLQLQCQEKYFRTADKNLQKLYNWTFIVKFWISPKASTCPIKRKKFDTFRNKGNTYFNDVKLEVSQEKHCFTALELQTV